MDGDCTCLKAVCDCDAEFSKKHAYLTNIFNKNFHTSNSKVGWNPKAKCQKTKPETKMKKLCNPSSYSFTFGNKKFEMMKQAHDYKGMYF